MYFLITVSFVVDVAICSVDVAVVVVVVVVGATGLLLTHGISL